MKKLDQVSIPVAASTPGAVAHGTKASIETLQHATQRLSFRRTRDILPAKIETARLVLRAPIRGDVPALVALADNKAIAEKLARYDPGNQFSVDYMWYTTGIAYNTAKIKERLGERPITSWDQVLRPENLKKLADCGVYFIDSPEDIFSITLNYLKLDPNSKKPEDIKRAEELLSGLRRYVKKFHSSEYINALANGDICLAIAWSGDSFQARSRAKEAGNGVDIAYVIPQEGTLITLDALAIPKDAPHPAEAHLFIDFLMRPDIAARNSNLTHFANGVLTSKPLVDPAILANPAIYPDAATMSRLFAVTAPDLVAQKGITRAWTRVKTGR